MSLLLQIVALSLAFLVVRKIIDIRNMYKCIPDEDIRDYFEGRLKKNDKVQYEKTIAHLGVCEKCQGILESLAHSTPDDNEIESHLVE